MTDSIASIAQQGQALIDERQSGWDVAEYGNGGVEAGVSGRMKQAWHGLLTIAPGLLTMEQAFEMEPVLGLPAQKVPVFDPDMRPIEGKFLVQRSDGAHLGVVGTKYTVVQNRDLSLLGNDIIDTSGGQIETMLSLRNGSRFFVLFNIPREIKIAGLEEETIKLYLLLSNSHDGSSQVSAVVTPVRAECENTQAFAIKTAPRKYTIPHTKAVTGRLQQVKNALGVTYAYTDALERIGNEMVGRKMRGSDFSAFLNKLVPLPEDQETRAFTMRTKAQEGIRAIYNGKENLEYIRGTRWAALQAVTEYWDHGVQSRETSGATSEENRFERITEGDKSSLPNRAFALLS